MRCQGHVQASHGTAASARIWVIGRQSASGLAHLGRSLFVHHLGNADLHSLDQTEDDPTKHRRPERNAGAATDGERAAGEEPRADAVDRVLDTIPEVHQRAVKRREH